ncbi:hypothetical protein ACQ1PF_07895 [Ornithobacterium rhinotracheale]
MSIQLYINDQLADIGEQKPIYIKQVNDFSDIKTRETNYSLNIKLPKTARNRNIFELAGEKQDNSSAPYRKLNVRYIVDGVEIVGKGQGFLQSADADAYNFNFKDGNINFYDAIKDLTVNDILIERQNDLKHTKTVSAVIESFKENSPYVYAIADYGGEFLAWAETHNGKRKRINIDYLIPSISVEWLFKFIFNRVGFTYSIPEGIIENKYITISDAFKSISDEKNQTPIVKQSGLFRGMRSYNFATGKTHVHFYDGSNTKKIFGEFSTNQESGTFIIKIKSENLTDYSKYKLAIERGHINEEGFFNTDDFSYETYLQIKPDNGRKYIDDKIIIPNELSGDDISRGRRVAYKIALVVDGRDGRRPNYPAREQNFEGWVSSPAINWDLEVAFIPRQEIVFSSLFSNLKVVDFLKAIMTLYGLTPFVDQQTLNTNEVIFRTMKERINDAPVIDWSDKKFRLIHTDFKFSNLGQENNFRYKYTEEDADYYDGKYLIPHEGLERNVEIKNLFFAPVEQVKSDISIRHWLYKFPLWEKEIKEIPPKNEDEKPTFEISYKEKKGRFFIFRAEHSRSESIGLVSKATKTTAVTTGFKIASFSELSFDYLLNEYYGYFKKLTNKMKVLKIQIQLNPLEVRDLDLYSRVYIRALGSEFIINKIKYQARGLSEVELIKISK